MYVEVVVIIDLSAIKIIYKNKDFLSKTELEIRIY